MSDNQIRLSDDDAVAISEDAFELDLAFFSPRWRIAGYEIPQLTLKNLMIMEAKRCPLLPGGPGAQLHDLAEFVALVTGTSDTPEQICEAVLAEAIAGRDVEMFTTAKEIINFALSRAPVGNSDGGMSSVSAAAAFTDLFASEYGWTIDQVMNLGVAQAWQLYRSILLRKHGDRAKSMIMTRAEAQVYSRLLS